MSIVRSIPILLLLLAPVPTAAQTAPTTAERVLAAASIPGLARAARDAGVADAEVVALLGVLTARKLPGTEARSFFEFVQSKVAAGVRGKALSDAIRAEHVARGTKAPGSLKPRVVR